MAKTSTFVIDHDVCKPDNWTPHDVLLLARYLAHGDLAFAARLSALGMRLVDSVVLAPAGGTQGIATGAEGRQVTKRPSAEDWFFDRQRRSTEGRRLWRCWACDSLSSWSAEHGCYCSMADMESGDPFPVWCSEDCRLTLAAEEIVPLQMEPEP